MRKRYRSSPNLSCKEGRFAIVGPALLLWPIIDVRLPQTGSKTSPPARHYQGECTVWWNDPLPTAALGVHMAWTPQYIQPPGISGEILGVDIPYPLRTFPTSQVLRIPTFPWSGLQPKRTQRRIYKVQEMAANRGPWLLCSSHCLPCAHHAPRVSSDVLCFLLLIGWKGRAAAGKRWKQQEEAVCCVPCRSSLGCLQ